MLFGDHAAGLKLIEEINASMEGIDDAWSQQDILARRALRFSMPGSSRRRGRRWKRQSSWQRR